MPSSRADDIVARDTAQLGQAQQAVPEDATEMQHPTPIREVGDVHTWKLFSCRSCSSSMLTGIGRYLCRLPLRADMSWSFMA